MTAHATIRRNIADKLTAATAIKNFCVAGWSLGCAVILEAFGIEGLPAADDAPFLFVYSDGENESGGETSDSTFEVVLLAGCLSVAAEGSLDETVVSTRTATANGLTVRGGSANAEALLALAITATDNVGAVLRSVRITSSGTIEHPLHWARARLSFYEPNTLN